MEEVLLKNKKKSIILTVAIVSIITIIIILAIIIGILSKGEKQEKIQNRTEEEIQSLTEQFEQIFINSIKDTDEQINFNPKYEGQPIIFTRVEGEKVEPNLYDVKIHIPYINIDNEKVDEYNKEIEAYINKANSILENTNKNTIYTVEYAGNVENNILSLIIRINLKEGNSAQRVIIQTYNYDIENNKEITLEELLNLKNININEAQNKIKSKIEEEQRKVDDLKQLGYNIYNRDITSEGYDIENSTEFYYTNEALYVIYAYGNKEFTSEMDLIII